MKTKLLLLMFIALILTACDVGTPVPLDMYVAGVSAERTLVAVSAAQTGTADARQSAANDARDTAQAISGERTATQQAVSAETTRSVATSQASATLQAQTAEAIASATAWPMTATPLAATQIAVVAQAQETERRAYWAQYIVPLQTFFWPLFWCAVLVLLIIGAVLAYRRLMPIVEKRAGLVRRGGNDAPLILTPNLIVDIDRNFGPALLLTKTGAQTTGLAPHPMLQARVTENDQKLDIARALPAPVSRSSFSPSTIQSPVPVAEDFAPIPTTAPWSLLDDWQGGALPLGVGNQGLILADPENSPHLLSAGASGAGKTRYCLRPVIAAALASGWQVAVFDRSGLDFLSFDDHPNAHIQRLDEPAAAVFYLEQLYGEIQRRFGILTAARVSTWGRLPDAGPRVLAVFDEFSNLADSLDSGERESLWRGARMVAAEGRKAGVHLALALQDPTYKSIDLRIRRNCTPISFRVKDADASRVILGASGAEVLGERQFITVIGALLQGFAFAPGDDEIAAFLDRHPAAPLPEQDWLALPAAGKLHPGLNDDVAEIAGIIRRQWEAGERNMTKLADLCGERNAGAFHYKLQDAIRYLESSTTTTKQATDDRSVEVEEQYR